MSVNRVIILGHIGNDPVIRYANDIKVASVSLATSESYTNKSGEKVTSTEWHNIVAWRGLADVMDKFVKKGSQLYVEGKITTRKWDDKEGVTKYSTEIVADKIELLGGKKEGSAPASTPQTEQSPAKSDKLGSQSAEDAFSMPDDDKDDLPF